MTVHETIHEQVTEGLRKSEADPSAMQQLIDLLQNQEVAYKRLDAQHLALRYEKDRVVQDNDTLVARNAELAEEILPFLRTQLLQQQQDQEDILGFLRAANLGEASSPSLNVLCHRIETQNMLRTRETLIRHMEGLLGRIYFKSQDREVQHQIVDTFRIYESVWYGLEHRTVIEDWSAALRRDEERERLSESLQRAPHAAE